MQLRYRLNKLQETFIITKEVNLIYQDLVKEELRFYVKIITVRKVKFITSVKR